MTSAQAFTYRQGAWRAPLRPPRGAAPSVRGRILGVRSTSTYSTAPGYSRPSGAAFVRAEDLGVSGLQNLSNAVPSGKQLTLPASTFQFSDFANGAGYYGVLFGENCYGLAGSGIDQTVLSMTPGTSTKAGSIPAQSAGGTNNYSLLRVGTTSTASTRSPIVQGLTIAGTDQPTDPHTGLPHFYNGLQLYQATASDIHGIKITGIPGHGPANPDETFSINDYRGVNNTIRDIEIDGRKANGVLTAATLIGLNYVNGFNLSNANLHHSGYAYGTASFMGTGTINFTNVSSEYNTAPFNWEQNVATINMRNCIGRNCRSQTTSGVIAPIFMIVDGNQGSSVVNIYDPITDYGTPTPANPLIVVCHTSYNGIAAKQLASDIHLYLGGVERRDCLRIATNETLPPAS